MCALAAPQSVEDKRALIRGRKADWKSLFQWKEKIWRFEDPNDDGHFDKKSLFFEGLNTEVTGLAGGILFRDNTAYVTCLPDMLTITDTQVSPKLELFLFAKLGDDLTRPK